MSATYELWLEDDGGTRIMLLEPFFFSYSRTTVGYGSFQVGLSYQTLKNKITPVFLPDRRVSVWRSPAQGVPMRRERTYLLREERIYTREDSMDIVVFYGRDGMDLLNRRWVIQAAGSAYATKTNEIDDLMKAIVREQMLYGSAVNSSGAVDNTRAYPSGEFAVDADVALGPSVTKTFQDRNVLDVLKELKDQSFSLNETGTSSKIYFDVVESQISGSNRFGWAFRTYASLRGTDRTNGVEFSVENENLRTPEYSKNHMDEINSVFVKNGTLVSNITDPDRIATSRWNLSESVRFGYFESTAAGLTSIGNSELGKGIPVEDLNAEFLNTPGDERAPQSLYGIDWDLGDLLPVSYAGMQFDAEVKIVYVAVDETGKETITGRNKVG